MSILENSISINENVKKSRPQKKQTGNADWNELEDKIKTNESQDELLVKKQKLALDDDAISKLDDLIFEF
jgi:hypothetical protein